MELFNGSDKAYDLYGVRIVLNGAVFSIDSLPPLAARGHATLLFDGQPANGAGHAGFKLPREGGTLLLLARDGATVMDLFMWKNLTDDVSKGRRSDGDPRTGFFSPPSFGEANDPSRAAERVLPAPLMQMAAIGAERSVVIGTTTNAVIRYSIDGSIPEEGTGRVYKDPIALPIGTVVTARAFAPRAIASEVSRIAVTTSLQNGLPVFSLNADTADLWDAERGIDVEGAHSNFSRRGKEWERAGFLLQGAQWAAPVRIRINGSGSRSLPKRSFTLTGRDSAIAVPGLGAWRSITLRADASPHAFLRALFMEEVVRASSSRVDMQPSLPVELCLNGHDRGTYRAMPTKNTAWVRSLNNDGPVDLLSGPDLEAVSGDRDGLDEALDALHRGAPVDAIEQCVDLGSLTDLACFDLYMGRGDHDLNVRCWKPRDADGRWRWILYDVDLWSPVDENSLERMSSSGALEAPYLPAILGQPEMRDRLVARMVALLNTVLAPGAASISIDRISNTYYTTLALDHDLWQDSMISPSPEEAQRQLVDFARRRPEILLRSISKELDLRRHEVLVTVDPPTSGTVLLDGLVLTDVRAKVAALASIGLHLEARAAEGMEFVGWGGPDAAEPLITIDPARTGTVSALFRPVAVSRRDGLQKAGE